MNAEQLKELQQPLKETYRQHPAAARVVMHSSGTVSLENLTCRVATPRGEIVAGLHPAAGGDGSTACSGDMLLDSLIACAGVTFAAVATAMQIPVRSATVRAEADLDFRGTLGIARDVPVGITAVRLVFQVDSDAPRPQLEKLVQLVERYCVIARTLVESPVVSVSLSE